MAENNEKKIELEEGEIMRMSVRNYDPETGNYELAVAMNGRTDVLLQAIMEVLKEDFGMQCVNEMPMMGIAIRIPCWPEEDEESDEDENSQQES